jgi:hypothetical protein
MNLNETGSELVNWIQLAEDKVQWRPLVNKVMGLRTS